MPRDHRDPDPAPPGVRDANRTLTATYERKGPPAESIAVEDPANSKVCPMCAETVKAAALVCRFCDHTFVRTV
jgi:hypothetical protein